MLKEDIIRMEIGRQKGNYRLRLIDLKSGKSRTTTIYSRDEKLKLDDLMKKIVTNLTKE